MPRRRRGTAAAAMGAEYGLALRILLHSPKDTIAALLAFAACGAIIANALFLQSGPHPSPMFVSTFAGPAATPVPRPRPRPAEVDALAPEPGLFEPRLAEPRLAEPKLIEPKAMDPLGSLVKATTAAPLSATPMVPPSSSTVARPPTPIPPAPTQIIGSRRVAAIQRALTEYGYGQLKPTGTVGADTQAAIQKFERERKMPVTGQVSERLVHELVAVIGHPIE
jgi:hypothetical protein